MITRFDAIEVFVLRSVLPEYLHDVDPAAGAVLAPQAVALTLLDDLNRQPRLALLFEAEMSEADRRALAAILAYYKPRPMPRPMLAEVERLARRMIAEGNTT